MAVRQTMLPLIEFMRRKIGDPDNGSPVFETQEIQDALDAVRLDVFDEPLRVHIERTASAILYKRHSSRYGFYETDYTLLLADLSPATPDVAEVMRPDAIWTFNDSPTPPVWLQYGKSYDIYRVAADLLEQMIALKAGCTYDVTMDGQTLRRSQTQDTRWKLVQQYRMKQRAEMVCAARRDGASAAQQEYVDKVGPVSAGVPFLTGP